MAKKGQTFNTYSEELKREVIRLKLEEGWSYRHLREHFGIKSDAQIAQRVKKVQCGESLKDQRGVWNRKHFYYSPPSLVKMLLCRYTDKFLVDLLAAV